MEVADVVSQRCGQLLIPPCQRKVHHRLPICVARERVRLRLDELRDQLHGTGGDRIVEAVSLRAALQQCQHALQARPPHGLDDRRRIAPIVKVCPCGREQLHYLHALRIADLPPALQLPRHGPTHSISAEVIDWRGVRLRIEEDSSGVYILHHASPGQRSDPHRATDVEVCLELDDRLHDASATWQLGLAGKDVQQTHKLGAALGPHRRIDGGAGINESSREAQVSAQCRLLEVVVRDTDQRGRGDGALGAADGGPRWAPGRGRRAQRELRERPPRVLEQIPTRGRRPRQVLGAPVRHMAGGLVVLLAIIALGAEQFLRLTDHAVGAETAAVQRQLVHPSSITGGLVAGRHRSRGEEPTATPT
mmetsp:Transcript_113979/g.329230  ORF Transcript_113979/g.329230 Transcript_113979/m.329230 type:complete len:363 (+) Transcript_113979:2627-3715(+)